MKTIRILLACLTVFFSASLVNARPVNELSDFAVLPVLDEGRVKPLDTFARINLKQLCGAERLPDISAIEWLAEVLFDQESAYSRPVFFIANPQLVKTLTLDMTGRRLYSYQEISASLRQHLKAAHALFRMPPQDLSADQAQLVALFQSARCFVDLRASLYCIPVPQPATEHAWFSPWHADMPGHASAPLSRLLREWEELARVYQSGDDAAMRGAGRRLRQDTLAAAGGSVSDVRLRAEVWSNSARLFAKSLWLYCVALAVLVAGFVSRLRRLRGAAFLLAAAGAICHAAGIILRTIIMARPPVSGLYESMIGIAFIGVMTGLVLERRLKSGVGTGIALILGSFLLSMAFRQDSGDTMKMLPAVLNTNLWLAVHVVTIILGFAFCLAGGILAHFELYYRMMRSGNNSACRAVAAGVGTVVALALFFTVLGTMLGGLWADQSWGRFWGWDPKENGALLVIVWIVWLMHGRASNRIGALGYCAGIAALTIIVALAWLGVNLLSVGKHSYGFTQGVTTGLGLFCAGESCIILSAVYISRLRSAKEKAQAIN